MTPDKNKLLEFIKNSGKSYDTMFFFILYDLFVPELVKLQSVLSLKFDADLLKIFCIELHIFCRLMQ